MYLPTVPDLYFLYSTDTCVLRDGKAHSFEQKQLIMPKTDCKILFAGLCSAPQLMSLSVTPNKETNKPKVSSFQLISFVRYVYLFISLKVGRKLENILVCCLLLLGYTVQIICRSSSIKGAELQLELP